MDTVGSYVQHLQLDHTGNIPKSSALGRVTESAESLLISQILFDVCLHGSIHTWLTDSLQESCRVEMMLSHSDLTWEDSKMNPIPHGPSFPQVPFLAQLLKNCLIFQTSQNLSTHRYISQKKPLNYY